jgi:hypothetical protein
MLSAFTRSAGEKRMAKATRDSPEQNVRGDGLRGPDQQQGDLRDVDCGTYSQPAEQGIAGERTPHQDAQPGAEVRRQPSMVQREEDLPEGLWRERKGPYDKNVGRNEPAPHLPKNWGPSRQ